MILNSIQFTIMNVKYSSFILLLLVASLNAFAKQPSNYFDFEATGIEGSQVKTINQEKTTKVFSTGGFIKIKVTPFFKTTKKLTFRAYYKDSSSEKNIENPFDAPIYLYPGKEFFIDLVDINTNKIIKKYIIQRPKLYPKIDFYKYDNSFFFTTKPEGKDSELSLSPGDKIRLKLAHPTNLEAIEVEYSLRNLKTKKTQQGVNKYAIKDLNFESNTDYELRINYAVQKESTAVIYIHVKPYWYQSYITYFILLFLLLGMAILWLTLGLKKKINTSQKKQQKLEQAAIRLQSLLNPHFTFNALSSIQGLMNTNRIDEANLYLQEFSSLLRKTLTKSQHLYNTLDQELEMMRMYIRLEAFRFDFSWKIEVAKEINPSDIEIPTLLLQPLIENAIKHGISGKRDKGELVIICKEGQKKDTFVIEVKDNGKWIEKNSDSGYGLSLTKERIATINKMRKDRFITLNFTKNEVTTAILTFHNWINN